jgi:multiple sugar transport system permease protein
MRSSTINDRLVLLIKPHRRRNIIVFWLLLPSLIIFALFAILPIVEAVQISFSRFNLTEPDSQRAFIGFDNYRAVIADRNFWGGLERSIKFVLISVTSTLIIGFYIANLLLKATKGKNLFRILFLVPMTVSPAITSLTFKFMLNYDFGVINYILLNSIGLRVNLLGDARLALLAIVGIDVWIWTPLVILIIHSGLESLPEEIYEAAALDGAGAWALLRHITLPMMKRFILIASLIRVMDAFRVYEIIQLTTAGGPGNLTETLNLYIARRGFSFFEMGPASAMAIILTIIIIVIGMIFVNKSGAFEDLK